jgi:hypothetical protein
MLIISTKPNDKFSFLFFIISQIILFRKKKDYTGFSNMFFFKENPNHKSKNLCMHLIQ